MLITFESNAHTDVTMFADIAKSMIKMMGHSGTIPSAIAAKDLPQALEQLNKSLEADSPAKPADTDDDEEEPSVSLAGRAFPLVEMIKAAINENEPVMWYEKK